MIDKKLSVLNYFISIFMFTRSKGKVPDNESSYLMHPKKKYRKPKNKYETKIQKEIQTIQSEIIQTKNNIDKMESFIKLNHNVNNHYISNFLNKIKDTKKQKDFFKKEVSKFKSYLSNLYAKPEVRMNYLLPSNFTPEIRNLMMCPAEHLDFYEKQYFRDIINFLETKTFTGSKFKYNYKSAEKHNFSHTVIDSLTNNINLEPYKYVLSSYFVEFKKCKVFQGLQGRYDYSHPHPKYYAPYLKYFIVLITYRSIILIYTDISADNLSYVQFIFKKSLNKNSIKILKGKNFTEMIIFLKEKKFDGRLERDLTPHKNYLSPAPLSFVLKIASYGENDQPIFDMEPILQAYETFSSRW